MLHHIETITFWAAFILLSAVGFSILFINWKKHKEEKQREIKIRNFLMTNQNARR